MPVWDGQPDLQGRLSISTQCNSSALQVLTPRRPTVFTGPKRKEKRPERPNTHCSQAGRRSQVPSPRLLSLLSLATLTTGHGLERSGFGAVSMWLHRPRLETPPQTPQPTNRTERCRCSASRPSRLAERRRTTILARVQLKPCCLALRCILPVLLLCGGGCATGHLGERNDGLSPKQETILSLSQNPQSA